MKVEPKWLTISSVKKINSQLVELYGGLNGIRDYNLLLSALDKPENHYYYSEIPPDIVEFPVLYMYGIIHNHPFLDGNKRTATACCELFLLHNESTEPWQLKLENQRIQEGKFEESVLKFTKRELNNDQMAEFIRKNLLQCVPNKSNAVGLRHTRDNHRLRQFPKG